MAAPAFPVTPGIAPAGVQRDTISPNPGQVASDFPGMERVTKKPEIQHTVSHEIVLQAPAHTVQCERTAIPTAVEFLPEFRCHLPCQLFRLRILIQSGMAPGVSLFLPRRRAQAFPAVLPWPCPSRPRSRSHIRNSALRSRP